jgi:hypothetical protein
MMRTVIGVHCSPSKCPVTPSTTTYNEKDHLKSFTFRQQSPRKRAEYRSFKIGSRAVYFSYVESQKVTINSHYGEYLSQTPLEQHLTLYRPCAIILHHSLYSLKVVS